MPTVFVFFGLRFMFFSNDHEFIHIHVIKSYRGFMREEKILTEVPFEL